MGSTVSERNAFETAVAFIYIDTRSAREEEREGSSLSVDRYVSFVRPYFCHAIHNALDPAGGARIMERPGYGNADRRRTSSSFSVTKGLVDQNGTHSAGAVASHFTKGAAR